MTWFFHRKAADIPAPRPPSVKVDLERRTDAAPPCDCDGSGHPIFVHMTDADVLGGRPGDPGSCAVALAASRAMAAELDPSADCLQYSDQVQRWILAFDAGVEVGPIDFWLIPAHAEAPRDLLVDALVADEAPAPA
jgi:hypothetical protein